jgi:hypothetical protein
VSFLEKTASELLLELTQEQQETVSGGTYTETTEETKDSYYKKYESSEQTVDQGKEDNPMYRPLASINSILGMNFLMPKIRF